MQLRVVQAAAGRAQAANSDSSRMRAAHPYSGAQRACHTKAPASASRSAAGVASRLVCYTSNNVGQRRTVVARESPEAGAVETAPPPTPTAKDAAPSIPFSAPSHVPSPAAAPQAETDTFQWEQAWYPVMAMNALDPKVPMHVDLLGRGLVVWADRATGAWHCFEDRCPHRLAPLSEGRVEAGGLMCSYHGWTFEGGSGACVRIPQIDDPKAHATACASPRSCVTAYPTQAAHGLLWVWPEGGPKGAAVAASIPVPAVDKELTRCKWLVRDLPIRYDVLMENVLDPSHVAFAHHGVQGNRNKVVNAPQSILSYGPEGYMAYRAPHGPQRLGFYTEFKASALLRFTGQEGPASGSSPIFPIMDVFIFPTKPGWSRMVANFAADLPFLPSPMRGIVAWMSINMTAYQHATIRNPVLDGDTYLLHALERVSNIHLDKGIGAAWNKAYYMPANADTAIIAWRKWLEQYGGAVPTCSPAEQAAQPPLLPRSVVLDRYSQHVVHCPDCQAAVRTIDWASAAAVGLGLAAGCAGVCLTVLGLHQASTDVTAATAAATPAAASAPWTAVVASAAAQQGPAVLGCLAVAGLCAALWSALRSFRPKFFFEDYIHAHKD